MYPRYHTPAVNLVNTIPIADSTLINGKGRYPTGSDAELAVVNVQQGKRYRLRLISISCDPNFIFSIDNHNLTVIEADGIAVDPVIVNSIQIFAGESTPPRITLNLH
jgi:iron transport multicopper oxidase